MKWKVVPMGEFLKHRDLRFKPNDNTISNLKRIEKIDFSGNIILSNKISNTDMILIKKGDLVISGINVEKGAVAVYRGDDDITATIHYSSYEFDEQSIDIDFLQYYLKSEEFIHNIKEQVPGGIKTEIKPKHLLPLTVTIPTDVSDQREIVFSLKSRFQKVGNYESENNHQLYLLKKLRQQILQDAVQGKLVPQDPNDELATKLLERIKSEKEKLIKEKKIKKEKPLPEIKPEEIPFEIPVNWVWCRLRDTCTKITDGTHHSPPNKETGAFKYVTAKNIKDYGIDLNNITFISEEVHKQIFARCNPEHGDILYIKDGATTGIVAINNLKEQFSMLSSVALIKVPISISNKYLMYLMRSPYFYQATRKDMYGVAITRVTLEKIQNSLIALPPLSEQKQIVSKIEQLMKLCDELEHTILQNKKYTQDLLQVALKEALEAKS
jgi:type I restriction enzyme S subunit